MSGQKEFLIAAVLLAVFASLPGRAGAEEIALLNHRGAGVAYVDREDGSTVYLWKSGIPTAYLKGPSIYGFNGAHLGWFEDGIVRGSQGRKVGYTEETIAAVGRTADVYMAKGVKKPKPTPAPPEPEPVKPVFLDSDSPLPLRNLLVMGRPTLFQ